MDNPKNPLQSILFHYFYHMNMEYIDCFSVIWQFSAYIKLVCPKNGILKRHRH